MNEKKFKTELSEKRFEFGKNWKKFLSKLNNERIKESEKSLLEKLKVENLRNKSFIDIGSGSGLFSLAAKNLGASVTSFDFDTDSVLCTKTLKSKFHNDDGNWKILQGSILDKDFIKSLNIYDVVYSWGVLHHTGKMWVAIDNCLKLVNKEGVLFISIYNDQGLKSHIWWTIKWIYNSLPNILKKPFGYSTGFFVIILMVIKYLLKFKPMVIVNDIIKQRRGMNLLNNIIDWYGGFPYEFADYNYLIDYIENKGFKLENGVRSKSLGCHELIFKKL